VIHLELRRFFTFVSKLFTVIIANLIKKNLFCDYNPKYYLIYHRRDNGIKVNEVEND
jgi:hypothetical protein